MSTSDRQATPTSTRPAGVEGDGLDAYPTYRDAGTSPHVATANRPTDSNLPRSRRTFGLPLLLGILAFALLLIIAVIGGGMNMFATSDEAASGDGAAAPVAGGNPGSSAPAMGETPEAPGTLDRDVEVDTQTSPGEVEATPGAIDAPGGEITEPVGEAPAQ